MDKLLILYIFVQLTSFAFGEADMTFAPQPKLACDYQIPPGACLVEGKSSPPGNDGSRSRLKPYSDGEAGDNVIVKNHHDVINWCRDRLKKIKNQEPGFPKCKGIVLGGHAGGGGVTDFLLCEANENQGLTFLDRPGKPGELLFDALLLCLTEISEAGSQFTIASCAGAYESGPPCAHYIAKKTGRNVQTTNGFCTSGNQTYGYCEKGWKTWKPTDPAPPIQVVRRPFHFEHGGHLRELSREIIERSPRGPNH